MKNRSYLGEKKTRYKMYKKGKSWVTMGVTLLSVGLGLKLGSTVNADNVSNISSDNLNSVESKSSKSLQSLNSDTVKLKSSSAVSTSSNKGSDLENQSSVKETDTSSSRLNESNKSFKENETSSKDDSSVSSIIVKSSSTDKVSKNSVNSSSSSVENSVESSIQKSNTASKENKTSSSVQSTSLESKSEVQPQELTVKAVNDDGDYDGTKGQPMSWSEAYDKVFKDQYGITIYLMDANKVNGRQEKIDQRATLWNGKEVYYGAYSNTPGSPNYGVVYDSTSGTVTVHPPKGWKFDIPYTKWYDPKRNGPYWESADENHITFSFENALKAAVTLKGQAKGDAISLFMVKDGEKSPEIPTPSKDSYQGIINWVVTDPNGGDESQDGWIAGQYIMNFNYGNQNPKEIYKQNPKECTYIVYAPKGYKFKLSFKNEYNYVDPEKGIWASLDLTGSPDPEHIAFYHMYTKEFDEPNGGHFTYWNDPNKSHQQSDKLYVEKDPSWQGGPSSGFIVEANAVPTINGKDQTVKVGTKLNLQGLVTAKDFDGKSITPSYSGNVDFNKPGKYTVTYTAKGEFNTVTKQITITVEAENKPATEPSKPSEDKPADKPAAEPSKPSENKPTDEPAAEPSKPSEDKPADKPTAEPSKPSEDKPTDKPATEPIKPSENKPADEPAAEPSKPSEDKPADEPAAEPSKPSEDKPADEPAAEPSKPSEDKPADEPAAEPSKPSEDKPADEPAAEPSKSSEDKLTDKNVIKSSKVVESDSVVESEMVSNKASESKTVEEPVQTNNGVLTAVKASKVSSKESAEKSNSGLPSTGETESKRTTAILGSAILGLLGLMGVKLRKKH